MSRRDYRGSLAPPDTVFWVGERAVRLDEEAYVISNPVRAPTPPQDGVGRDSKRIAAGRWWWWHARDRVGDVRATGATQQIFRMLGEQTTRLHSFGDHRLKLGQIVFVRVV